MLGLFSVSGDSISSEGPAGELLFTGVSATGSPGTATANITVGLTGVSATASVGGDLKIGGLLGGVGAEGATGVVIPSITRAVSSEAGTVGNLTYALTWTVGNVGNSSNSWYYGFRFEPDQTNLPTISHLGRLKLSGNIQTHTLYLYKYNGAYGNDLLASVQVDLAGKPDNQFVYGRLSAPVKLQANNTYYVYSEEFYGGDTWAEDVTTTHDSFTSGIATHIGSGYGATADSFLLRYDAPHTYGPVNFKTRTGRDSGLTELGDLGTGNVQLQGVEATGAVGTLTVASGDTSVALTGISATCSVGSVTASVGDSTVPISGVSATGVTGNVTPPNEAVLAGVSASGMVGSIGGSTQKALSGVSAAGVADLIHADTPSELTGIEATGGVGTLGVQIPRPLRGILATAHVSPMLIPLTLSLGAGDSRVRWVGHRILVDGVDLASKLSGPLTIDSSIDFGQQNTLSCHLSDSAWPAAGNLWGNKPVQAYLSLGTNPRLMTEHRIFTGYTYQKRDTAGTPAEVDLTCADASIAYTGIPVCYSLGAYSGKTRGQVITEVAETVGVILSDVPQGGVINKPISLNNADLLQWIAEFGLVENWYPHIDRYGNLSVRILNQPATGWVIDADSGDFDLNTLQETYPTRPPCRWYVTGTEAVPMTVDGDPGSPDIQTVIQVDEESALYNPKCIKSVDPTGHSLPAAELMVIARITTEITTVGGDEIKRITTTESFYNPAVFDINHDTYPAGTNYDDAYTDNSFHRDPIETLMETSKITVTTTRDSVGTVLSQHTETMGWYTPQSRLTSTHPDYPERIINGTRSLIYADGKAHVDGQEYYQLVGIVDTTYEYDATNGTLLNQVSTIQGWTAPETGCDTFTVDTLYADQNLSVRVSNSSELTGPPSSVAIMGDLGVPVGFIVSGTADGVAHSGMGWITGTVGASGGGIDTRVNTVWRRDFKWGEQDWRTQVEESFEMVKRVSMRFTVADGQIISTKETTEQFVKIESGANPRPYWDIPPLMFADGKWYEGPETFGTSGIKFTHYERFGSAGHAATTYSVDLLTGEVTIDPPVYSDGTMPLAPTIGSTLRWARMPMVVEVSVENCEFVDSKQNLDLPWAENEADLNRAGLRAAQRAMAIIREFDCAWNPLVEPGDGLLLTSREHGIIAEWHVITDIKATAEDGADMHIIAERWPTIPE